MEMQAIKLSDMENKREIALRSSISFRKRNFDDFCDGLDGFDEISTEERKRAKRRNVRIAKLQTALFSLKYLVSENRRLERSKALYPALKWCSIIHTEKSKSAISKWARAGTMAAKVGKGLSKDRRGQKLALRHWLEVVDTHHRYGHNLHFYFEEWVQSQSSQPFFYWLDNGDGKEVNLLACPRSELQSQCIRYLKPEEREAYEVTVNNRRLVYRKSKEVVHTPEGSKWIFVLSTSRRLYIGEKKKGLFHHSSFLAGAATIASGRLVAFHGVLDAMWPYSGHYCPTPKQFKEFIGFLEQHNVDLTKVKTYAVDDDVPPSKPVDDQEQYGDCMEGDEDQFGTNTVESSQVKQRKPLSNKWTTWSGPKISCARECPTKRVQALLSPRVFNPGKFGRRTPIPSPESSLYLGLATPRLCVSRKLGPQSYRYKNK